jgi:hypothetical protein
VSGNEKDDVVDRADSCNDILLIVDPVLVHPAPAPFLLAVCARIEISHRAATPHSTRSSRIVLSGPCLPAKRTPGPSGQQRPSTRSSRSRFLATLYYAGWHQLVEAEDWPDELPAVVQGAVPARARMTPRCAASRTIRPRKLRAMGPSTNAGCELLSCVHKAAPVSSS